MKQRGMRGQMELRERALRGWGSGHQSPLETLEFMGLNPCRNGHGRYLRDEDDGDVSDDVTFSFSFIFFPVFPISSISSDL